MNNDNINKFISILILSMILFFATFIVVFHRTYYNRINDVNIEYKTSEDKTLKQLIEEDKQKTEYIKKLLEDYVRD